MLNITIVEDHKALRESLVDVLALKGHCITAYEGVEAMQAGGSLDSTAIMVLDLNLPARRGRRTANRL